MATLRKFMFDLDFGLPLAVEGEGLPLDMPEEESLAPQAEPEPPPPSFTEEDVALVRQQAYESGRQAGVEETEAATERLSAMALASLAERIKAIDEEQQRANQQRLDDAVEIAVAVIRKIYPRAANGHAEQEILGVVKECLERIETAAEVMVRVNPDFVDAIRVQAEELTRSCSFSGNLVLAGDDRIAPGDCRVEWGDGGAERISDRLWQDVEALVARAKGEAVPMREDDNAVQI